VAKPITQTQVDAFEQGIYFAYEDLTTAPAQLIVTGICSAQVVLSEGRYHQIKRMFGHFRNQVLSIHRSQIGHIKLPVSLAAGHYIAVSDPMDF
jgi:16S rRNA pseudouridine516 synthase